jgi:superfamily II DNA helicase RecQ
LSGRDVFAALPTGYGKSLCYGCLPLARDKLLGTQGSIVLVVSPLIALMKDQVQSFRKRGISAAYVTSDGDVECEDMKAGVLEGKYQLVFIRPEQLIDSCMCQSEHHQDKLIALVADEAHCVKKW